MQKLAAWPSTRKDGGGSEPCQLRLGRDDQCPPSRSISVEPGSFYFALWGPAIPVAGNKLKCSTGACLEAEVRT